MKPSAFEYHAPTTRTELVELLSRYGDDARILAGGQTLVAAMNLRLARPAHLVDINGVEALDFIKEEDGKLKIGALTRHRAFEHPVSDNPLGKLLKTVVRHIAHAPIRNRGTFAGSLANSDPSSEWCLVCATLDAEILALSKQSARTIPINEYFVGALTTALQDDEVLAEVHIPLRDANWKYGFAEFSRRAGDFALAMTCVAVKLIHNRVSDVRIGIGGATVHPIRMAVAENALKDQELTIESIAQAAALAASNVDAMEDIHASIEYRRDLVRAMTRRALTSALQS